LAGKNALFIDSDPRFKNLEAPIEPPEKMRPYFEEIIPLDPILIRDSAGVVLRKFNVFKGLAYKPKN
ncbi:MAG: hypothetical protein KIH80_004365, partial [Flavobacteriia bacterium]|nr:hypothetical protein [Flavobacteriia bacterium]